MPEHTLSEARERIKNALANQLADPRNIRLWDLKPWQFVLVQCPVCGRVVHFAPGTLERRHRVRGNALVHDLRHRMRCQQCNTSRDIKVTVEEARVPETGSRR